jgi:hypothetical protein
MTDPDDREDGFYWISVGGQAAEVAQWQLEWTSWLVVGGDLPLTDAEAMDVRVLSACLVQPPTPVSLHRTSPAPPSSPIARDTKPATLP